MLAQIVTGTRGAVMCNCLRDYGPVRAAKLFVFNRRELATVLQAFPTKSSKPIDIMGVIDLLGEPVKQFASLPPSEEERRFDGTVSQISSRKHIYHQTSANLFRS